MTEKRKKCLYKGDSNDFCILRIAAAPDSFIPFSL